MPLLNPAALAARDARLREISLTVPEALVLCDLVNSLYLSADPTPDPGDVAAALLPEFEDAADFFTEEYDQLDAQALHAKMSSWDLEHLGAVTEAAAQYGLLPPLTVQTEQALAAVGLYRPDDDDPEAEDYDPDVLLNGTHVLGGALRQLVDAYPTDDDGAPASRLTLIDPAGTQAAEIDLQPGHLPWLTRLVLDETATCRAAHRDGSGRCGHCRGTGQAGGTGGPAAPQPPGDDGSRP